MTPLAAVRTDIALLWLLWIVYWLIAGLGAKPTRWRESYRSQLFHRVPLALGFILLAAPRLLPRALDLRLLPPGEALAVASLLLVVAGLGFTVWARRHLGRNWSAAVTVKEDHALIRTGPYRWVRHPIYTGALLALLGTAAAVDELRAILALLLAFAALLYKSRVEEARMAEIFPDYALYRRTTPALIPFLY
jgi:protein-S-isoprenylcysteine O-methyltransferase Ste14